MKLEIYADRETLVEGTFEDQIHDVEIEVKQPSRFPIELPSVDEIKRVFVDGYYKKIAEKAEVDRMKRVAMGKMKSDPVFDPEPSIKQAA